MIRTVRNAQYDWMIIGIYLSLIIIGWFSIYAATYTYSEDTNFLDLSVPITKQTVYIAIALSVFIIALFIDVKFWHTFAYIFYGISIFLLLLVLFVGSEIKGARAWFVIGGFSFQPSEIAKFCTTLAVSSYLSYYKVNLKTGVYQWIVVGIIFAPVFFILLQPDAGSAITFLSLFILLFIEGFNPVYYISAVSLFLSFVFSILFPLEQVIMAIILAAIGFSWFNFKIFKYHYALLAVLLISLIYCFYFLGLGYMVYVALGFLGVSLIMLWRNRQEKLSLFLPLAVAVLYAFSYFSINLFNGLELHQQERIKVWLKPSECDPRGSLYNLLQSKVAIGSGGMLGKGFMNGNMTKLKFVPEQSTDFIFSTIGEEQGFFGSVIVILLFVVLIWRILNTSERITNKFASYFGLSLAGFLFIHVLVNIGMTMGLVPIIGIPLPFISKGGSSLIGFSLMLGVFIRMQSRSA
ncbi:MAG: rod shape-determining protein RodA [Saprospiraceae bacterium]|nr:rod shape-determining protein RodA [Candidatus Vicinibacter proximus]MBL7822743.1 rod shape-determining protein RodA [Saprospiraceae bacterium]MCC6843879.1 rod shape-determining protein RodA [Saprospiraceae bacterium]